MTYGYNEDRQHAMEDRDARQLRQEAEAERVERFSEAPPAPCRRLDEIIEKAGMACGHDQNMMIGYLAKWVEHLELDLKYRT